MLAIEFREIGYVRRAAFLVTFCAVAKSNVRPLDENQEGLRRPEGISTLIRNN